MYTNVYSRENLLCVSPIRVTVTFIVSPLIMIIRLHKYLIN